ncbi:MAG: glycosyltransferase [Bacilli bacterium]|nr:glycosyltransferase [Bacilli bacterium]
MKKITILSLHMGFGGIESAIASLSNLLCKDYKIEIVSIYELSKSSFYIDPRVKITYLLKTDLPKKVENYKLLFFHFKWFKLCKKLYQDYLKGFHFKTLWKDGVDGLSMYKKRKEVLRLYLQNCDSDIILSTRDFINTSLMKHGKKDAIKIGWEHNHHNGDEKYIQRVVSSTQDLDYLILVSKELQQFYEKRMTDNFCTPIYIPNFIETLPKEKSKVETNHIVTVGRLSKEKGHLDLIEVMDIVRKKGKDFHLDIIGAGPEEEAIRKKIADYDLTDKITMHGFLNKEQMHPILKEASIFTLPSYTESFGIVLLEALSYGIPCIAFDSAQGAREIIEDNWDGYLIQNRDKEKMAKRVIELLNSPNRRIVMGANAVKKAKQFTGKNVKKEWVKLFEKEK